MSKVTDRMSAYIRSRHVNVMAMSRATRIPYGQLYASLCESNRKRPLRDDEFLKVCSYLEVDPYCFGDQLQDQTETEVAEVAEPAMV